MNSHWLPRNRIILLENGEDFYPRVFDSIGSAEHEVLLETFILFDDKVGRELQQVLLRAAGRGAEVNVLIDGWGSPDLPSSFLQPLQEAGVKLRSHAARGADTGRAEVSVGESVRCRTPRVSPGSAVLWRTDSRWSRRA